MRIERTFSIYFASIATFITLFVMAFFLFTVDTNWYETLLIGRIFFIPNGLFIFITALLVGLVTGWVVGISVKKKAEEISFRLSELERGNYEEVNNVEKDHFYLIWDRIDGIRNILKEQARIYQKLTTERVEWNNQMKEEVLTKERNRLARELHDSVSQQLFAATMLLSAINQNPNQISENTVKQRILVEEIINDAQTEMRALLLHLRPVQLEGKSLKAGMEEILTELTARLPMKVTWKIQDVSLDKGVEDHLFRILQESVSNTLRHAKASLLEVTLMKIDQFIFMKIIDDGKGFELESEKTGSFGLINIKERAVEIGGYAKIISILGKGTSIEVKVPILMEEGDDKS